MFTLPLDLAPNTRMAAVSACFAPAAVADFRCFARRCPSFLPFFSFSWWSSPDSPSRSPSLTATSLLCRYHPVLIFCCCFAVSWHFRASTPSCCFTYVCTLSCTIAFISPSIVSFFSTLMYWSVETPLLLLFLCAAFASCILPSVCLVLLLSFALFCSLFPFFGSPVLAIRAFPDSCFSSFRFTAKA